MATFDVQSIEIAAPLSVAFRYIADPANLPEWTHAFTHVADGRATMNTPAGVIEVDLGVKASEAHGTVDWTITFPDGAVAKAASRLVEQIQRPVYNVALRMLWHPEDARDATQEILIRVITHLGSFRGDSRFLTWIWLGRGLEPSHSIDGERALEEFSAPSVLQLLLDDWRRGIGQRDRPKAGLPQPAQPGRLDALAAIACRRGSACDRPTIARHDDWLRSCRVQPRRSHRSPSRGPQDWRLRNRARRPRTTLGAPARHQTHGRSEA